MPLSSLMTKGTGHVFLLLLLPPASQAVSFFFYLEADKIFQDKCLSPSLRQPEIFKVGGSSWGQLLDLATLIEHVRLSPHQHASDQQTKRAIWTIRDYG
mmetsp:Transcript_35589/g.48058  ORF Transcript_35589/g.48058 Transcript_35589/m.48058 type:complete len:99 (-) Transcript_35589:662-958(-)